jgi:DNA-binding MarR family transcriptional regulator
MERPLLLFTLLSQALVAFTIEFDNEFERQMPHRTTDFGSTGAPNSPWLVSMVMWTRFLQFVPDAGISVRDLQPLVRMPKKELDGWLKRLADWWGYLILDRGGIIRPSQGGRQAQAIWRSLTPAIEARWQERFSAKEIDAVRAGLAAIANHPDVADLPDSLPILGYGLTTKGPEGPRSPPPPADQALPPDQPLPAMLSRPLLAFALEFERDSDLSLAISANLLRLLGDRPMPVRELPGSSGVSKEAIAVAIGFLEKRGCVKTEPEARGSRFKAVALLARGRKALERYEQRVQAIDDAWQERFGADSIRALRERLARLDLSRGLQPHPTGWRAKLPPLQTLPHFPMILHRGGYPDGA